MTRKTRLEKCAEIRRKQVEEKKLGKTENKSPKIQNTKNERRRLERLEVMKTEQEKVQKREKE